VVAEKPPDVLQELGGLLFHRKVTGTLDADETVVRQHARVVLAGGDADQLVLLAPDHEYGHVQVGIADRLPGHGAAGPCRGLVVAAFVAPPIYYGGELPVRDGLFPLQPKSTAERLFWILGGGVTAGVVEETLFRGFALTRLGRLLGSPWLALPVTMVAFVFLHGSPPNLAIALNFAVVGAVFGVAFILMRCRRLEVLILVHAAVNVLYIFVP